MPRLSPEELYLQVMEAERDSWQARSRWPEDVPMRDLEAEQARARWLGASSLGRGAAQKLGLVLDRSTLED